MDRVERILITVQRNAVHATDQDRGWIATFGSYSCALDCLMRWFPCVEISFSGIKLQIDREEAVRIVALLFQQMSDARWSPSVEIVRVK